MEEQLKEEHFDFSKGKDTRAAIGLLRRIGEKHLEKNKDVLYIVFVDLEKAFDKEEKKEIGLWLRRNCLLKDALEEMTNGRRVRGRRRYQVIDDIKIYGSYAETKRKAEDKKDWRILEEKSVTRIIGPFFFVEATVTGNVYLDMLWNFAVDQLPQDRFFSRMGPHPIIINGCDAVYQRGRANTLEELRQPIVNAAALVTPQMLQNSWRRLNTV
ncbi:hypothetical protein ANN_09872 [Periplaneta americana]|uniref:Reverse transcriptase domain-containing protein n=1 Tax=Periplaneta americana TaxID=6978 RepID=A0ABQ8TNH8_PERAM|nr:hypothetical protein ANN_09872 [Periplaneta americana]